VWSAHSIVSWLDLRWGGRNRCAILLVPSSLSQIDVVLKPLMMVLGGLWCG
jgi:hypothetical protein